ncbi:branched-chain amino acid ABC transporter permease [Leucobacter sp. GX24907]
MHRIVSLSRRRGANTPAYLAILTLFAVVALLVVVPATAAGATTFIAQGIEEDSADAGSTSPDELEWGYTPRVINEEGEGVVGVSVTVSDESGEVLGSTVTQENGIGSGIGVPDEGTYIITADTSDIDESFVGGNIYALAHTLGEANTLPVQRILINLGETANDGDVELDETAQDSSYNVSFKQVARQVIYGVNLGLILAIAVLGMTLIMGTTRLTNFAYGDSLTIGALVAYFVSIVLGLPIWIAGMFSIAAGALIHFVLDAVLWSPARRRGISIVPLMIATIGVGFIIRYVGYAFYGGSSKRVTPDTIPSTSIGPVVFPVSVYYSAGIAIIVLIAVTWWLRGSRSGRAIRAVAANRPLAAATGVNIDRTLRLVWIISGALAGLAGILMAFLNDVAWDMGFKALLVIFAAVILGGVGSTRGAVLGALIVGVLTEVLVIWMPSDMKFVGGLVVLILVLLVRPQGIFGQAERVG